MSSLVFAMLAAVWPLLTGTRTVDDRRHGSLEVAWSGCRAERRGPTCAVERGDELVVWVRVPGGPATASACRARSVSALSGEGYVQLDGGADDGGCWTTLKILDPSGAVALRNEAGDVVWSLTFEPRPPQDPALARGWELFDAGEFEAAEPLVSATLERLRANGAPALDLASALDLAQKLAFRSGRFAAGLVWAEEAIARYDALGWRSRACDIGFALVQRHWWERGDAAAATATLNAHSHCVIESPRYAIDYRYRYADITERYQDPFITWNAYRELDVLARRLRLSDFEVGILSSQYVLADRLGQFDELSRIEARLDALRVSLDSRRSCGLVTAFNNVGWSRLMRWERGDRAADPRGYIEHTLQVYTGNTRCRDEGGARNAIINLALAELQRGRPRRAVVLLSPLVDVPSPEEALWRHVVLARAGLDLGELKLASAHVGHLEALARAHADPYFEWYAAVTRGRLHEVLAEPGRAIAAYELAEALRDEITLPLALGAGRERAEAEWDLSAKRLIALDLAAGQVNAAMQRARLSRRRALRALEALAALSQPQRRALADRVVRLREAIDADARRDVGRTRSALVAAHARRRRQRDQLRSSFDDVLGALAGGGELRGPADGELILVYYPLGERWVGFAADAEGVLDAALDVPPGLSDEALGQVLFQPFAAAIERARRVTIVATGALLQHDLHGLPYRGRPLLANIPVAYGLDLSSPRARRPRPIARGVVVAANPGGETSRLRFIDAERKQVISQWDRLGLATAELTGEAAVRGRVLGGIGRADIFHFLGHGMRSAETGRSSDGWDQELRLEGMSSLSVEDVMAMMTSSEPRVVVLSACETALVDARATSGGLAIGQSFLVRGAELVIATARPVGDEVAARLVASLYAQASDSEALAQPGLLSAAQQELLGDRSCDDLPDVCAFRAWVP